MRSIALVEKPIEHVPNTDWIANVSALKKDAETGRRTHFETKFQGKNLRNDAFITSNWANYHNNKRLEDRITASRRCLEDLDRAMSALEHQHDLLSDEKATAERCVERIQDCLHTLSQVLFLRDNRDDQDLVYDVVHRELQKEISLLENSKQFLADKCFAAWEELKRLSEVSAQLKLDASHKTESLDIDSAVLALGKNDTCATYKPDVLRVPNCAITYEAWLETNQFNLQTSDRECTEAKRLRESIVFGRDKAETDFLAQFEVVNFEMRKKIFETDRQKTEMEYQRKKLLESMSETQPELERTLHCHHEAINELKCAESRVEYRNLKPCHEQTRDDAQIGLLEEIKTLRDISNELRANESDFMNAENEMEKCAARLQITITKKSNALDHELKALELHKTMFDIYPLAQVDRNVQLFTAEKQAPVKTIHDHIKKADY